MKRTAAILLGATLGACQSGTANVTPRPASSTKVGPPTGAVMVVGGGSIGKDIFGRFIELAGGPDALIIDVPVGSPGTELEFAL